MFNNPLMDFCNHILDLLSNTRGLILVEQPYHVLRSDPRFFQLNNPITSVCVCVCDPTFNLLSKTIGSMFKSNNPVMEFRGPILILLSEAIGLVSS